MAAGISRRSFATERKSKFLRGPRLRAAPRGFQPWAACDRIRSTLAFVGWKPLHAASASSSGSASIT